MSKRIWERARKHHGFKALSNGKPDNFVRAKAGPVKHYSQEEIRRLFTSTESPDRQVIFDSGWYEHRSGTPLPSIESFRVRT